MSTYESNEEARELDLFNASRVEAHNCKGCGDPLSAHIGNKPCVVGKGLGYTPKRISDLPIWDWARQEL